MASAPICDHRHWSRDLLFVTRVVEVGSRGAHVLYPELQVIVLLSSNRASVASSGVSLQPCLVSVWQGGKLPSRVGVLSDHGLNPRFSQIKELY